MYGVGVWVLGVCGFGVWRGGGKEAPDAAFCVNVSAKGLARYGDRQECVNLDPELVLCRFTGIRLS